MLELAWLKPPARCRRNETMRLSRTGFLKQVADQLPSMLPPAHRGFQSEQWGRYFKLWYRDKGLHFEVQFLRNNTLEIAFHMESDKQTNAETFALLESKRTMIGKKLGDDVELMSHMPRCFAAREVWRGGELRGEEAAIEAAARIADYVVALRPIVEGPSATRTPSAPSVATASAKAASTKPRAVASSAPAAVKVKRTRGSG